MNWKRTCRCPECRSKLTDFGVDLDTLMVECGKCHTRFSPLKVLQDSEIVLLSELLPQKKQEKFLTGLGFEKLAVRRTPKPLLYGFLSFLILGTAFLSVMLAIAGYRITSLSPIIGGLLLSFLIYDNYRDEEKRQWRRRIVSGGSAPSNG